MPNITNPTAGDVHVNTPLTNFGQKWLQTNGFVATKAMPSLGVAKQSDLYWKFNRDDFLRDEAKERADGAESAGGGFDLGTDQYYCRIYAFHKDVSDRQRANQDSQIQLDKSAMQFSLQKIALRREALFLSTFFETGIWTTDLDIVTTATGDGWDTATGDPIEQIRQAISVVQGRTGFRPNRMLVSRDAWDAFLDNDSVLDRVNGGATTDLPALVMKKLVAAVLEIESIEVVESVVNTAVKGAAEATAFAGNGEQCLVYYAPQSVNLEEPTAGCRFNWTGLFGSTGDGMRVKKFRMEATAGDRVEAEMAVDDRVIAPELGYMLHNVL